MSSSLSGTHVNVGMMTSGGLAPCLSSSIASLMTAWKASVERGDISGVTFRLYKYGYKGLLLGESIVVDPSDKDIENMHLRGGSPIGNSRVKLTNVQNCIDKGYIPADTTPLEVASQQLKKDNIQVLHTVGGDDTNTQAAKLSAHLKQFNHDIIVIGMPKTIDNDVKPILQTLGAHTAAEQGSRYFANIVSETSANPKMLILHECMGRDCGYLTAMTARLYRESLKSHDTSISFVDNHTRDVHAIWIPEMKLDLMAESERLKSIMDSTGCVNVFFGEGTGVKEIVADMEANGETVTRDAFGHVKLDVINPGAYFAKRLSKLLGAEKTMVQKSGYFARSAPANKFDQELIQQCADVGVATAIQGTSGCMGQDEEKDGNPVRAIEFERIEGHKLFDTSQQWFQQLLKEIGQI